jgi:hypothetical protein
LVVLTRNIILYNKWLKRLEKIYDIAHITLMIEGKKDKRKCVSNDFLPEK